MKRKHWIIFGAVLSFVGVGVLLRTGDVMEALWLACVSGCGWFAGLAIRDIQDGRKP